MLKKHWFKLLIIVAFFIRILLIFLSPPSLLSDGVDNYIPSSIKLLEGNLDFWYPPLYIILISPFFKFLSLNLAVLLVKLLNLIICGLWVFFALKLLKKLGVSEKHAKIAIIIALFSAWSLIISSAIHNDMLFMLLFTISLNLAVSYKTTFKDSLLLTIIVFLMIMTKPTGWLALPTLGLLYLLNYRTDIKVCKRLFCSHSFCFISAIFSGALLSSIWLIKNLAMYGSFYFSATTDSASESFDVITQITKSFEYFWEFPSLKSLANMNFNFSFLPDFIANNMQYITSAYYFFNLLLFIAFSLILLISLLKLIKKNRSVFIRLFIFSFPIAFFSLFYWPFFGIHNYWDTGRYSLPIFLFFVTPIAIYITEIKNKRKKLFFNGVILLFALLSFVNSVAVIFNSRSTYNSIIQIKGKIEEESSIKELVTNDKMTQILFRYFGYSTELNDFSSENGTFSCENANTLGDYNFCIEGEEILLKKGTTSR